MIPACPEIVAWTVVSRVVRRDRAIAASAICRALRRSAARRRRVRRCSGVGTSPGVGHTTIWRYESGLKPPTPEEGPFLLFEFADQEPIVRLEHLRTASFLRNAKDVREYREAVTELRDRAMSPAKSRDFIRSRAEAIESELR